MTSEELLERKIYWCTEINDISKSYLLLGFSILISVYSDDNPALLSLGPWSHNIKIKPFYNIKRLEIEYGFIHYRCCAVPRYYINVDDLNKLCFYDDRRAIGTEYIYSI